MSMEFGWWNRDPDQGKYQVVATIHGGNLEWRRKQGHHSPWETHSPQESDWLQLLDEAGRRVPRRLLSPKQMAEIQRICDRRKL